MSRAALRDRVPRLDRSASLCIMVRNEGLVMPWVETSRAAIVARLGGEGWVREGGTKHDKFSHPSHPYKIIVPRHRILTTGVARVIAKAAGWL